MGTLLAVSLSADPGLAATAETRTDTNIASVSVAEDTDYGYLLVHFLGDGGGRGDQDEQLYFTISPDATMWYMMNDNASVSPVTTQKPQGSQGGIRDPHIIRKHDGSGFYIIATDLSIYHLNRQYGGQCWSVSQWEGSHNIIIWEMDNEMNLTEPRMAEIAPENAGCTWAPEAIWDDEKEAYMVFWSALGYRSWYHDGDWEEGKDWSHHVYRCYTEDFETFTEPEIYIESEQHIIDTTILKEGDTYYRFTKVETGGNDDVYNPKYGSKTVFMEESKSLSGEFRMVKTYSINGEHWSQTTGYEGAEIFKLHERDSGGTPQWCLALDNYSQGGYKPFVTDDITKGEFVSGGMAFEVPTRHGAFLPLKKSEYDALCAKWNDGEKPAPIERENKEVFSMSFEENTDVNTGSVTATAHGDFTYEDGVNGGKAAKFDGQDYIEINSRALAGVEEFTVSFAAKVAPGKLSWIFYADKDGKGTTGTETYCGIVWNANNSGKLKAERYLGSRNSSPSPEGEIADTAVWNHITIVYGKTCTYIYVNGALAGEQKTTVNVLSILGVKPTIYIGKATWGGSEYSNCVLDEFRIYNYGLSGEEVTANYKSVMGV